MTRVSHATAKVRRPRRVRCNRCRCRVPRHYAGRRGPRGGWVCEDCRDDVAAGDPGTSLGRVATAGEFGAGAGRRRER